MNLNKKKSNKRLSKKKINKISNKKNKNNFQKKNFQKNKSLKKYDKLSVKDRLNNVHPLKLFSKDELIKYYKETHKYYSKCILKEFEIDKLYKNNYQNIYSNKQIKTLWNLSKNDRNIGHRLLSMLTKRMNPSSYINIVNILNKFNKDEDIYNKLHKIYLIDDENREKKELCSLVERKSTLFYEKIMDYIINIKQKDEVVIDNYLDIGCGNCKVTEQFGKYLGLKNENIYGADFSEFDEQTYKINKNIQFTLLKNNYKKLPYETNSISLISLVNVIHHVNNLNILLQEVRRILKPNGILMIIETDVLDYVDYMLLDIEHLLYHFVYNKNRKLDLKLTDLKDTESNYFNWLSLDLILKEYNFSYKYSSYLSRKFKFEINNNREFIAFYMFDNN